jgi:hypothetical protein
MGLTRVSGDILQTPLNVGVVTATRIDGNVSGDINSTGVSTFSTLKVGASVNISSGIITATTFSGDGSRLVGVATTKNLTIGRRTTAATISVVGTGITLSLRSGIGTVNF